ncbi:glycosyl hydrolase family protein [Subtercola vilae]|uniref:Glycosyl hydrolase family protein n=1 Tax=Subtercola vilae TaxID=2056433 RepID=A0A4V4RFR6_9MICO|nr:family 1 glycosylhydrolase [Subtercola vilae]MEA9985722.1 family 1 glycosylhydrolase [Subtercola sp. RTI3]TIH37164.1 glycosyl hydrolase family protein [Subtercola vilae]
MLPTGFVMGVATSAFQVEGAVHDGGRELSVWDDFSHQPGRIRGGANADTTADHYGRFAEDVDLMTELGIDSYRFSFGWPRLQPGGSGSLNPEGIAFYDRLLDRLLAAGISPMATLFHWDTPVELRGGWLNRDTAHRFGDYAYEVGEVFGDRIDRWVTLNEPATVMLNGYALGIHAPGSTLLFDALPAGHNQLLGHGLAVQALRAASVKGAIGIANVYSPTSPVTSSDDDVAFAGLFDTVHNTMFGDAVLLGRYPEVPDAFARLLRPIVEADPADLATIHQPLDFYGVNYYFPTRIASGSGGVASPDGEASAMTSLPFHLGAWPEFQRTNFGWPVAPEFMTVALEQLAARYGDALPPVFVTEGGVSLPDEAAPDAETGVTRIVDSARIDYLTTHLEAALEAAAAPGGATLLGYYVWSLLDNFEWAAGYSQRFGLVHVDFSTGDRTPKESFAWLQRVLEARS